ncbi:hypothetical protein EV426DRAFT_722027 [Tirmania nivea]|nr:hypothetical protein EV426DRAFT_722027 [Tirmania nivea]
MTSVCASTKSLLSSLLSSLLGFIKNTFESVLALFSAFYATTSTAVASAFDLFKAILHFLISNILLMVIIAAGFFGYNLYLQRQRGQKVGSSPGGSRPPAEKSQTGHEQ